MPRRRARLAALIAMTPVLIAGISGCGPEQHRDDPGNAAPQIVPGTEPASVPPSIREEQDTTTN